ncbi:MAG: hypothetical protein IJT89_09805 [Bacteroidaceae bacterium]|uniref:hypothetical protein n=1 Tax=unclassified Bacteroides TaxID=2646097 RepID=UPI0012DF2105|nr:MULTISPECIES: hypothetical protein [unclassified Bacteroides]MBP5219567.1 hypothetical protein [Bacteroidaceae bacterium]MBQ3770860.1 hypothetical protein [Bacteroidaceae bacterium]MBQ4462235.1 hypothetical protein [Bacteroidaceae bacterium]MBQ5351234.1 hypothetical protein [Bacteroidaceae bacterium]MBQ7484333.1 hypothetical protein [Bacteroidaceae bacterium]
MNKRILISAFLILVYCSLLNAHALYSYRNVKKVNKATSEELPAKNQLEYVSFSDDRTKCFFSDIDGNNMYGETVFVYMGEKDDMYHFHYQDPNDNSSFWDVYFSKDYKTVKSTTTHNPFIKIYELLEMIKN